MASNGTSSDNSVTDTSDHDAAPRTPRKRGVSFWIAMVCLPAAVTFVAMDGDLLRVGAFSTLGMCLILQTGLRERSAAWRRTRNTCALVFSGLVLLLFLRNSGLV